MGNQGFAVGICGARRCLRKTERSKSVSEPSGSVIFLKGIEKNARCHRSTSSFPTFQHFERFHLLANLQCEDSLSLKDTSIRRLRAMWGHGLNSIQRCICLRPHYWAEIVSYPCVVCPAMDKQAIRRLMTTNGRFMLVKFSVPMRFVVL